MKKVIIVLILSLATNSLRGADLEITRDTVLDPQQAYGKILLFGHEGALWRFDK